MIKHYITILLSILAITITSCSNKEKVGFSPYTPGFYELKGGVKSVTEEEFGKKSKLFSTKRLDYDNAGHLLSYTYYENPEYYNNEGFCDTVKMDYQYNKSGRLENIASNSIAQYTPKFNKYGDLIEESYVTTEEYERQDSYTMDYTYDEYGNVTKVTTCYSENDTSTTEYLFENNKLRQVNIHNISQNIQCECDTSGLIISKKYYDPVSYKLINSSSYTYKFDAKGNWIEKTEREQYKVKSTTKRDIVYYLDSELADNVPVIHNESNLNESHTGIKFIDTYINSVKARSGNDEDSPSGVLFIILIICTVILTGIGCWMASDYIFEDFTGEIQDNGMKKMWMYNTEPYTKVGSILLIGLAAFVVSILLILLVGGVIWGLLWLVKLILWAIIIIGWLCLIGGVLGLLAKEGTGCLGVIIGGVIVAFQDDIERVGENLVNWGFEFMQSVNMFGWGLGLFQHYWDVIFLSFLSPFAIFLGIAFVLIAISLLLNGFEYVVTKIYSIRRPCPSCGSTETPEYIIGGKPHPVSLHPGIYGIFYHKSPVTGEKVPTMYINGKGKITRRCTECNTFMKADTEHTLGTDIHIGIVGHRSSGKSYLLYSGLSSLMNTYPERFSQIDADNETKIEDKKRRIDSHDGIQTNVAYSYRAVQLMLKTKFRPVPYHLFFYDVAGEKFNSSSASHKTAMDFYQNVQSIVFVIDPSMLDINGLIVSDKFEEWHKANADAETYQVSGSYSVLENILETVGRNSKKIDFNFVCTKMDMGYFSAAGYPENPSAEEIKQFITEEMGLNNLVNAAGNTFNTTQFYAVSATDADKSNIEHLFEDLLKQRNIKL